MSKINGDKARQHLKDRKSAKRRVSTRALREAAQQPAKARPQAPAKA